MERKLSGGDYLPGSQGGVQSLDGAQALLQRVLFRLTARRGQFPFLPEMGSRLYQLCRDGKPSARSALARQYTVQALESEENLTVTDVQWTQLEGSRDICRSIWNGRENPCLCPWTLPGKEGST